MSIQTTFSIKDLEGLSGVKAHTIRIWEKRYNILSPNRSDTNIRAYDVNALKKILNVVFLVNNGEKISKIAQLEEDALHKRVKEIAIKESKYDDAINDFKLSMFQFDSDLFELTYADLLAKMPVRDVFLNVIVPLLQDIGHLWTTQTVKPVHEHFITALIRQKLCVNIESVQVGIKSRDNIYALFLPMNEIHELGILYLHYELLNKGYNSVYFGLSLPIQDLIEIQKTYKEVTFISYFTVEPKEENIPDYLAAIQELILDGSNSKLHILGPSAATIDRTKLSSDMIVHDNILNLANSI